MEVSRIPSIHNPRIEIVTTDNASFEETGFGPKESCYLIRNELAAIFPNSRLTVCHQPDDLEAIVKRRPDLVIPAVKYLQQGNRKIWLASYFSDNQLICSGSGITALAYDSNKIAAKRLAHKMEIDTAQFVTEATVPPSASLGKLSRLGYPLFAKPNGVANSNGISDSSKISTPFEYAKKVTELLRQYGSEVLIESFLPGREFTVAVLECHDREIAAFPAEIIAPVNQHGDFILNKQIKENNSEKLIEVAESTVSNMLVENSIKLFRAMNAQGYGRFDYKMDSNIKCHFLEVNLVPGLKPEGSYFPRACQIGGNLGYIEMLKSIVDFALSGTALKSGQGSTWHTDKPEKSTGSFSMA